MFKHLEVDIEIIFNLFRSAIDGRNVRIGIILFNAYSRLAIGLNSNLTYEQLIGNSFEFTCEHLLFQL